MVSLAKGGESLSKNRRKKKEPTEKRAVLTNPVAYWLAGGDAADILCPVGYTPLSKNEEVRKNIHKIADMVSSMTIMLMENGENGDKRIKNELSRKLDIYPNKDMVRKNFIYKIVTDLLITGNSVVYPEYSGELLENLTIWNSERVSYSKTLDGSYTINYGGQKFTPDEVLHFVLVPDDDFPFRGQGYAGMMKSTLQNILQAEATKTGYMKSKWKPSLIISIEADAEELQNPEKRSKILGSYTETTEAGEPWLIPAGEVDVKTVQPLTLNDLAIQDSLQLDKKVAASVFGTPGFMVGIGEFNRDEYNNFIGTTIMNIARIIEQEFSKKLLHRMDWYFKFNAKSLKQYSLAEQMDFVTEMVKDGMLNRNEGRTEFDYSPVDDPGMNEYNVLENYIPVAKVGDQKKLKGGEKSGTA